MLGRLKLSDPARRAETETSPNSRGGGSPAPTTQPSSTNRMMHGCCGSVSADRGLQKRRAARRGGARRPSGVCLNHHAGGLAGGSVSDPCPGPNYCPGPGERQASRVTARVRPPACRGHRPRISTERTLQVSTRARLARRLKRFSWPRLHPDHPPSAMHDHPWSVKNPRMATERIPSNALAGRDVQLVDDTLIAYADWRRTADRCAEAYSRWAAAPATGEVRRFSAYVAALDQEASAANSYAQTLKRLESWSLHARA